MTATATATRTMPARFASTCAACGDRIRRGETIARHREVRQYVHLDCTEVPAAQVRAGQERNQLTRQRRISERAVAAQVREHQAREERRTEQLSRNTEESDAMDWALGRWGAEGVYADGERTQAEAVAWAVAQYRGSRLALHPDAIDGNAFGAVEAVQERGAFALEMVQDLARSAGVEHLHGLTRENAERVLSLLGDAEDPADYEIAAAINVANGRCPDGCCP